MFKGAIFRQASSPLDCWAPLTIGFLRDLYLAPEAPAGEFAAVLAAAAVKGGPWSESLAVAPGETIQAVERALVGLIYSTETLRVEAVDLRRLDPDSRVHGHLAALVSLWRDLGDLLPDHLAVLRTVIEAAPEDAVEAIEVVFDPDEPSRTAAERAVLATLERHHGRPPTADARLTTMRQEAQTCGAEAGNLLGHVQRNLLSEQVARHHRDDSLRVFGVRDAAMEADVAAGLAQSWLASDPELVASDIGILVEDPDLYGPYLREAFGLAGLPLSGLAPARDMRDVAGETVLLFLLCRRPLAPAMALASLYISPLMPWPNETGQLLATAIMGGDFEPRLAQSLVGQAKPIYAAIRRPGSTAPRELADELAAFADLLTAEDNSADTGLVIGHRIERLRGQILALPADAEIPWDDLIRSAGPNPPAAAGTFERTTDAITVLSGDELPWRPVRRMIVLGFSDRAFPTPPAGNPFFIDSEIAEIERACGLKLVAKRDVLGQRLQLLARQIAAASDSLTIFTPFRDISGKRIAPSGSLALIARCVEGIDDPAKLVIDLAQVDEWPSDIPRVAMTLHVPAPSQRGRTMTLGRDLLSIRKADDGTVKPQSPSRLEKLIVSPLAWLLEELDAVDTPWAPENADVMLKGSLAHLVFENLFPLGQAIPDESAIEEKTPTLLDAAIRKIAPFMQGGVWGVERKSLERDIVTAAQKWRRMLADHGATIVDNEFWLRGTVFGMAIHGKADCLLQLAGNELIIVDHKKSGSKARRARLEAGWDLQVGLYRAMARTPVTDENAPVARKGLSTANAIGVAYHLMNDGGLLLDGVTLDPSEHFAQMTSDISVNAMAKLEEEVIAVRSGMIRLNGSGDRKKFRDASVGDYAFDTSPLIDAYTIPEDADAGDGP